MPTNRSFPFYVNEFKGRDNWGRNAYAFYLDLVASGKSHDRAVELAVDEADKMENDQ